MNVELTTIGLFSMLGKITFGPFVEELEDDEDDDNTGVSSLLDSNESRYWSSVKIPFSISPILDILTKIFYEK